MTDPRRTPELRERTPPNAQQRLTFALGILDMLAHDKIARIATLIARSATAIVDFPNTGDPRVNAQIKRLARDAGFIVPADPMPPHLDEYIEKLEAPDR